MREEQRDAADAEDSGEDYVAPSLTDLGSFDELTQDGVGTGGDVEGGSGAPL
jgi:hypothetical protein